MMAQLKRRWPRWLGPLDAALLVLAFVAGVMSLTYPFGGDQGIYHYVGREWFRHGALPYRDIFEAKTPGIFILYGATSVIFGSAQWPIRLLDLLCVLALGIVAARTAERRGGGDPVPGLRGVSALAASLFYFGCFDFWNSAQCELWCGTLAMAGMAAARHAPSGRAAALRFGVWSGLALVMKPPVMWLVAVGLLVLLARLADDAGAVRGRARARAIAPHLAWAAAGAALVFVPLLAYFAARGGLGAMYEILVVNNRHYVAHGRWVHSWDDVIARCRDAERAFDPLFAALLELCLVGVVLGWRRRERAMVLRHALVFAVLAASFVGILMQLKFTWYHWNIMVVPVALATATAGRSAHELLGSASGAWRALPAALLAANVVVLFALHRANYEALKLNVREAYRAATGRTPRAQYLRRFAFSHPFHFSYSESEQLGLWLRDHSRPTDRIAVRWFAPEVYAVAERSFNGRFFYTSFIQHREWSYRIDAWREEDRQVFLRNPPRYVAVLDFPRSGPDSREYFEPLGYVRRHGIAQWLILEYVGPGGARP